MKSEHASMGRTRIAGSGGVQEHLSGEDDSIRELFCEGDMNNIYSVLKSETSVKGDNCTLQTAPHIL